MSAVILALLILSVVAAAIVTIRHQAPAITDAMRRLNRTVRMMADETQHWAEATNRAAGAMAALAERYNAALTEVNERHAAKILLLHRYRRDE